MFQGTVVKKYNCALSVKKPLLKNSCISFHLEKNHDFFRVKVPLCYSVTFKQGKEGTKSVETQ